MKPYAASIARISRASPEPGEGAGLPIRDLIVDSDGRARMGDRTFPCAIGRSGRVAESDKREGDGATPIGRYPIRGLLYRPDRVTLPATQLPVAAVSPLDGWCDDPADPRYNQPVLLPYPGSHERLWREDRVYDVIAILGHNDHPPRAGQGSAIFLHGARPDFTPTEGCVALHLPDLLWILRHMGPGSAVVVEPMPGGRSSRNLPYSMSRLY